MSVRFIHKISAILLAAGLLSCGREDSCILGSPDAISLGPGLETRAAITGTTMPDGFHIWLSAWYSDESNPSLDRN